MTVNLGGYILGVRAVAKDKVELSVSMIGATLFKKTIDTTLAKKLVDTIAGVVAEAEKMP